jgi:hypothetical protein
MTRTWSALAVASALALAGCVSQQETHGSRARSEGAFPADWTGRWTGALATLGDSKLAPVTMTLEIEPIADGRWSWTIIYEGEFGRQVRPYELVAVDAAAGQFVIDERNGIVIPIRFLEGTLYSTFEAMGSRIEVRETLLGSGDRATIEVEMATISVAESSVTGGNAEQSVPEVRSWTPRTVQRGRIARQPQGQ